MARKKKVTEPPAPPVRLEIDKWQDWLTASFLPEPVAVPEVETPSDEQLAATKKRRKKAAWATAAAVAILASGAGTALWSIYGTQEPELQAAPTPATVTATPKPAPVNRATFCADLGGTSEAGDVSTPQGIIASLQHDYYVTRDVNKALTRYSAETAPVKEKLAEAIAATPEGTLHCVVINPVADKENTFDVDLHTLSPEPDNVHRTYKQRISTRPELDYHLITELAGRKD